MIESFKDLAQFKLTNGSEIVCEVMEWPEDEGDEIIARNVMSIVPFDYDGSYIYGFKPWVHYIESPNEYITINPTHVVASTRPNPHLETAYHQSVSDMHKNAKERDKELLKEQEELAEKIAKAIKTVKENNLQKTEETSKVIAFPSKNDTVH